MLCNSNPGCCYYKGRGGANIEGLRNVSASTARVQYVAVSLRTYSSTESPHHSSYGSDLVNGFSLLLQPYQERRDLCWCGLSSHDVHHCSLRLASGWVVFFNESRNILSHHLGSGLREILDSEL